MTCKRFITTLLVSVTFLVNVFAQDVTFYSQSQVDAFNPSITTISGNLTIADTVAGNPINNLSNLSNLTSVGGYLLIDNNNALGNINGLSSLSSIGGDLKIENNNNLSNLNGLSGLSSIGGHLSMRNNVSLGSINGLSNLTNTNGYLLIENNPNLLTINGLSGLTSNAGHVTIKDNVGLQNLSGLSNMASINGYVLIDGNSGMTNIDGLSNLNSIGGYLVIRGNPILQNINGLSNLTSLGTSLVIDNNDDLQTINGLSGITGINGFLKILGNAILNNIDGLSNIGFVNGNLEVKKNNQITNIDALSNLTAIGGFLKIHQNNALFNIDGLSNITAVGGDVLIEGNNNLQNIDALSNLTIINGFLDISDNDDLSNLDALSNLTSIDGYLNISSNYNLQNINALSNLLSINGHLSIESNNNLQDIDALSNLTDIASYLVINNNDLLFNIDGLSNLVTIGGYLAINNNYNLLDISALSNIPSIGGYLAIKYNYNLQSVDALSNLTTINGFLAIEGNNALTELSGLSNITTVSGYLSINDNDGLTNLDDFSSLVSIDGHLSISDNLALTNIDGLSNFNMINGYLSIEYNASLTNIDGLSNVLSTNGYLSIKYNPLLENINSLSNLTSINGYLSIHNNISLEDVEGLSGISSIAGDLEIRYNSALTNLDGFLYLISIDGNLNVSNNSVLYDCCGIQNILLNTGAITGNVTIVYNPTECSNQNEVENADCGLAANIIANPPCMNADNGSMQIEVFNYDSIPFSYTWENLDDGTTGNGVSQSELFTIDNLSEGSYNITITEPTPAVVIRTEISLTEVFGSIFEITAITSTNSSNGFSNGSLTLTVAGGTMPYDYAWAGQSSGQMLGINTPDFTIPDLAQGTYYITVSDDVGNEQVVSVTLLDEVIPFFPCEQPLDIVILNDVSGSVDGVEYEESKQFFVDFLNAVNIGPGVDESRAAIIEWSTGSSQALKIPISTDPAELQTYLGMTRSFSGGTSPQQAMEYGYNYLEGEARAGVDKVLVLSTDGSIGQISPSLIALADEYKAAGYHIITIAFDVAYEMMETREVLRQVASIDLLAPGAPAYSMLDQNLAETIVTLYLCPVAPGSSATVYFNRDGEINIVDMTAIGGCPTPQYVEVTFTVEAKRELSLPSGTPVTFYYNDPSLFGSTSILTWEIPCAIAAGDIETFTVTLPVSTAANIYASLNDDGSSTPPMSFPVTEIDEIAYSNNIDNESICTEAYPTLQALKYTTTPTPICNDIVIYTVNVCNVSTLTALGATVDDIAPPGFTLLGLSANDNGCATVNGNTYDIPGGCCISITYTYDASNAADGYYGDQDVDLNGPINQVYIDFDGANTTAEDVEINGDPECPSTIINFNKSVNTTETCEDGFVVYTFTIDNQLNIPLQGIEFTDILPSPVEWTYQPYSLQGLSIANSSISGTTASFIIDQVDANTVASFSMDAYLGDWTMDGVLVNTATLDNVPDLENGGIQTLTSNSTTTNVSISTEIVLPDTIFTTTEADTISLDASLTGSTNIAWTTSGDGIFTAPNASATDYIIGENDILEEEIALFVSNESNCGEYGHNVVVVIVPVCEIMIDSTVIGDCYDSETGIDASDDTYEVLVNASAIHQDASLGYTIDDGTNIYGPFLYGEDVTITLPADGNVYILTFIDNEDAACTSQIEVSQNSCSCSFEVAYHIQDPLCVGDLTGAIVIDSLEGGTGPFSYTFDGDNYYPLDSIGGGILDSIGNLYVGDYEFSIIDEANEFCADDISFSINTAYPFEVNVGEDTTIYLGNSVDIIMTSTLPFGQLDWTWNDTTSLSCTDCINPTASPYASTIYYLEAMNSDGCIASDSLIIKVIEDYNIYIPNAFTPNGDGVNDLFSVYPGISVSEIASIQVFSRWGELVYYQPAYDPHTPSSFNIGWNGLFEGKKMNQNVFVYMIEFRLVNGEPVLLTGDVTLVR